LSPILARDAIELLADKWRIAILHLLQRGALRAHQLQKELEEVSPKMLTQTLRGMERDGLLIRTVYASVPARVDYELTRMGYSVIRPLQDLCNWAEVHAGERNAARLKFDRAARRTGDKQKTT
jgi:DNA-binding HxlR family transcriptional regulator